MQIPAGTKVRIVERISEIQMYRIKYNKRVGLFLMKDFAPIQEVPAGLMPHTKQMSALTHDTVTSHGKDSQSQVAQKFEKDSHQSIDSMQSPHINVN